ncbi:MAG TPA: wax ester/triacylglycerol synthase family O-acyltransferase [Thermomicrobiales bacterium]|nr:wax ester/triacylglycerol synthase family O-acyltransferase [Thermomicrobiales bacterium]
MLKRLNGMDAMLLYGETANLHAHTLKVLVADPAAGGQLNLESFRAHLRSRLPSLTPLRCQLLEMPWRAHHPMWAITDQIDLDYHVRSARVAAPGGRRQLDETISRIASTPLDRTRPLWEFHVAEGLADGKVAIIGKLHHSLADGLASVNLLKQLMGLGGSATDDVPGYNAQTVSQSLLWKEIGRDHLRQIAALPALVNDAVRGASRMRRSAKERPANPDVARPFSASPTFLNHPIAPGRTFATASLPLSEVKKVAKAFGVTFTDVISATASGALRELLLRYDGRAERPLLATVPICTDLSPDRLAGNEIGGLTVSLPVHVIDPARRVLLISAASADAKKDNDLLGPTLQGRFMEYLPPPLAPVLFRRQCRSASNKVMNVAISTVPGPRVRGNICGAPVTEIYSVGILSAGSAFNLTAWSYADSVNLAVLSDDRTFEDVSHATDAIRHAFAELQSAAGVDEESTMTTDLNAVGEHWTGLQPMSMRHARTPSALAVENSQLVSGVA